MVSREKKLLLLLVNVSDLPIWATLDFDAAQYDLPAGSLTISRPHRGCPLPNGRSSACRPLDPRSTRYHH